MVLALFYIIHVIISLFLVGVVLLQQGKGADLSVFGGGSTMTAFGARSATNILHKLTVVAFVAFMVTTLAIGVLQRNSGGTVMADVPAAEPVGDDSEASENESATTGEDEAATAEDAVSSGEADPAEAAGAEDPATAGEGEDGAAPDAAESDSQSDADRN